VSSFDDALKDFLYKRYRAKIIDETKKILDDRFRKRINAMQLWARMLYASTLSSYARANSLASNVGLVLPELEAITKALYDISDAKRSKSGSFETGKAFDVARGLELRWRAPMFVNEDTLTYKLKFSIRHPLLVALEKGEVSWEQMEKNKIIGILQSALSTAESRQEQGRMTKRMKNSSEKEILRAISKLKRGTFNIVNNKRPYMEITVKNLAKQKDFIDILIK